MLNALLSSASRISCCFFIITEIVLLLNIAIHCHCCRIYSVSGLTTYDSCATLLRTSINSFPGSNSTVKINNQNVSIANITVGQIVSIVYSIPHWDYKKNCPDCISTELYMSFAGSISFDSCSSFYSTYNGSVELKISRPMCATGCFAVSITLKYNHLGTCNVSDPGFCIDRSCGLVPAVVWVSNPSPTIVPTNSPTGPSTAPTFQSSLLPTTAQPTLVATAIPTCSVSTFPSTSYPSNVPTGTVTAPTFLPTTLPRSQDLSYHNGSILTMPQLYNIFIGPFNATTMDLIDYFAANIANTSWFDILRSYSQVVNGTRVPVGDAVFKERWTFLSHTNAAALSREYLKDLILQQVLSKGLQSCRNCIYNIMFFGNFTVHGWNQPHYPCAYHTAYTYDSPAFQAYVTVIGDPTTSSPINRACIVNSNVPTVNGDFAADNMVSTYAHELAEIITNPDGNSWYRDSDGWEISDPCNFAFGTKDNNFNIVVAGKKFLLQMLWQLQVGCRMSLQSPSPQEPLPSHAQGEIYLVPVSSFYVQVVGFSILLAAAIVLVLLACRCSVGVVRDKRGYGEKNSLRQNGDDEEGLTEIDSLLNT